MTSQRKSVWSAIESTHGPLMVNWILTTLIRPLGVIEQARFCMLPQTLIGEGGLLGLVRKKSLLCLSLDDTTLKWGAGGSSTRGN